MRAGDYTALILASAPLLCRCAEPSLESSGASLAIGVSPPAVLGERGAVRPRPAPAAPLLAAGKRSEASFPRASSCGESMVLVEGEYCPVVEQRCERYLTPYGRFAKYRCAEYAAPRCLSKRRQPMRFCMDRDEYTEAGDRLPLNHKSFTDAREICDSIGKRVCTESEWNFACEGDEMRPYPYGFERDPRACNSDRTDILTPGKALKDLRAPSDAFPECVSPFGVRNLSGNLEEFVLKEGSQPPRPVMKGAYWQPSQNSCRARQTVHGAHYSGTETGFRCCSAAAEPAPP